MRAPNPASVWEEGHEALTGLLGGSLHPGGQRLTRLLLDRLALRRGHRVLEVGCGAGSAATLAPAGTEWVGVDPAAAALRGARARLTPVRATGTRLPFRSAVFDRVVAECALCLLGSWDQAAGEAARLLRSGGRVGFTDFTVQEVAWTNPAWARTLCVDAPEPEALRAALRGAGLRDVRIQDASWSLHQLEERVQGRVDVLGLLAALAETDAESGWAALHATVQEARAARDDGRLRYVVVTARKGAPDGGGPRHR